MRGLRSPQGPSLLWRYPDYPQGGAFLCFASVEQRISIDRITDAYQVIDSVFKDSPQYVCDPISEQLGLDIVLKV